MTPKRLLGLSLSLLVCCAATAAAQQPGSTSGPLVLEPMNNGFVLAPDVKFTKLDGDAATLAGAYGGWVHDDHLLIGGAGYWRADNGRTHDLGYGGVIAGWIFMPEQRLSVTTKGLIGLGRATAPVTIAYGRTSMPIFHDEIFPPRTFRYHRDFVIGEPEIDAQFRITRHVGLVGGVSYRLVDLPDSLDTLARGASGSVSVQFGR